MKSPKRRKMLRINRREGREGGTFPKENLAPLLLQTPTHHVFYKYPNNTKNMPSFYLVNGIS
jgi:hypothetical protein